MAVNSLGYLILFPIIVILYYFLPDKTRVYLLTLASLIIYSLWDVRYTGILLLIVFLSWSSAVFISRNNSIILTGICLWITILIVVGMLGLIRFLPKGSVIAPVGISFYSLQALGYVRDVYEGKSIPEKNIIRYTLFISFFATITSGPIQRSDGFLKQIGEKKSFDYDRIRSGFLMIAYGLFAKNFVADRLEYIVSRAYSGYETETGFVLLIGVLIYAFQLYCDFMGYSYIALGSAKALGFELPPNFYQPYFSTSVKEFWSRWHISLSNWLRDYIYYPLGGNRKGLFKTTLNIMAVFLISGIWHGRGSTFIVWGALHGLYRIVEVLTLKKTKVSGKIHKIVRIIRTFVLVDFAWLFFRAESIGSALTILKRIFINTMFVYSIKNELYSFGRSKKELMIWLIGLLIVFIIDFLHEKQFDVGGWIARRNVAFRWTLYGTYLLFMIMSTIYYYGYSASTFIYSGF